MARYHSQWTHYKKRFGFLCLVIIGLHSGLLHRRASDKAFTKGSYSLHGEQQCLNLEEGEREKETETETDNLVRER